MREVININNNSTLKTLHLDLVENGLDNYARGVNWEGLGYQEEGTGMDRA